MKNSIFIKLFAFGLLGMNLGVFGANEAVWDDVARKYLDGQRQMLQNAVDQGDWDAAKKIIDEEGGIEGSNPDLITPLMCEVVLGNELKVKALIVLGADLDGKGFGGHSVREFTRCFGHIPKFGAMAKIIKAAEIERDRVNFSHKK